MTQLTFSVGDEETIRAEDARRARAETVRNAVHLKQTASRQVFLLGVAGVVIVIFLMTWMAGSFW